MKDLLKRFATALAGSTGTIAVLIAITEIAERANELWGARAASLTSFALGAVAFSLAFALATWRRTS